MFHRLEKGNYGGIRKLPKELVLKQTTHRYEVNHLPLQRSHSQRLKMLPQTLFLHTESFESHFALPKLSTRSLLGILLSMLKGNFGESLCYASNQNTDFQCSWREKDMVLWSTKNDFCVLFILWGEVTSKEDRQMK